MSDDIKEIPVKELHTGDKLRMNFIVKDGIYTHRFHKGQILTDEAVEILKNSKVKKVYIYLQYREKALPYKISSVETVELVPGMMLINNVYTETGVLIASGSQSIDQNIINKLFILNIKKVDIREDKSFNDDLYKVFEGIHKNIKTVLVKVFKDVLAGNVVDIKNLLLSITDVIIAAAVNPHHLTRLLSNTAKEKFPLIEHSSYVNALSLLMGLSLKMDRDSLIHLGISALLHDIGKFKIPMRLWRFKLLKPDEKAAMNKHTEYGYNILANIKKFDQRIPLTALQHHECHNGSGYPSGLTGDQVDKFAQIVGLANYYVVQLESESDKDIRYNSIINIIKNRNIKFDTSIANTFLSLIGYYPVNTVVRLNTNETGKVVRILARNIFAPEVVLLKNKEGREFDPPVYMKLEQHPELFIKEVLETSAINKV